MAKKPVKEENAESEKMFPETGMTDFEKEVAKSAGLNIDNINETLDKPSNMEEAYAQIMGNLVLSEGDRRKLMSQLSARDIHLFSRSYARAKVFDDDILSNVLDQELMLRVSKNREGRKEIIKLSGAIRENEIRKSWYQRLGFNRGAGQGAVGGM